MAYIGREPQIGNFQVCDAISVVNAQAAYTMQVSSANVIPESVNHMVVSLNGVIQKPGSSYTISSATITFSRNLVTGETIDFIYLLGNVLDLGTPSDDTVTGAKIVDNAINSEHYTDASIDLAHMSADSVDGSKIVDDAINSEHYTNASIDLAHMSADSVDGSKIVDDAINSEHYTDGSIDTAHIADDQITAAKLNNDIISGTTALDARPADADEFLLSDGGTLKRLNYEFIKPASHFFRVYQSSQQTLANNTLSTFSLNAENVDNKNGFASNVYTVQAGGAGQWIVYAQVINETDTSTGEINLRIVKTPSGGSAEIQAYSSARLAGPYYATATLFETLTLGVGDTIFWQIKQNSGSNLTIYNNSIASYAMGIKLN